MMRIRPAARLDALLLSRLNVHVQRLHAEAYPDLFVFPDQDDFALVFYEMILDDPAVYIFIAESPQPVGYIICRVVHGEGNPFMFARSYLYVDQITVEPGEQGKGIGKALMEHADRLAQEEGLPMIQLNSWAFNQDAHHFFFAQGYEIYNVRMWKN